MPSPARQKCAANPEPRKVCAFPAGGRSVPGGDGGYVRVTTRTVMTGVFRASRADSLGL
jgi:hypothetical protein